MPGHGPITDKKGVAEVKGYLKYLYQEAEKRYEIGMSARGAAKDIELDRYATWTDGERIAVNIASIFRELKGDQSNPNMMESFMSMADFALDNTKNQ